MENNFDYYFEKAVKAALDSNKSLLGGYPPVVKSNLKRHVQLLVYHRLERIIESLVP